MLITEIINARKSSNHILLSLIPTFIPSTDALAWHGSVLPGSSMTVLRSFSGVSMLSIRRFTLAPSSGRRIHVLAHTCIHPYYCFPVASTDFSPSSLVSHLPTNYQELLYLTSTSNYYVSPPS